MEPPLSSVSHLTKRQEMRAAKDFPNRSVPPGSVPEEGPAAGERLSTNVQAASISTSTRVFLDGAVIAAATLGAFLLRFYFRVLDVAEASPLTGRAHVVATVLWGTSLIVAMAVNRLYDEDTLFPGGGELSRLARSLIEASSGFAIFVFLTQSFYVSRSWFGMTVSLSALGLVVERVAVRRYLERSWQRGARRRSVIVVGSAEEADVVRREVDDFEVVDVVDPDDLMSYLLSLPNKPLSDTSVRPAFLIRAMDIPERDLWKIVLEAGDRGHAVFIRAVARSVGRDRLTVRRLGSQTIVKVAPPILVGPVARQKRIFDIIGATLLLLLTLPVILAAACAVLLTSGPPVFYAQVRAGARGRAFRMWKFRTMRVGAEVETGAVWAAADDQRRTAVGRLLRRFSLDELPQLWNVIKGDMSLVGPRPERPEFVEQFIGEVEWYRYRSRIRPGLTGLAQARGLRGNTSLESRIALDNWYIEHWSIPLDMKVLLQTVAEIFRGRNAY